MNLYLAGKIAEVDWRHEVVSNLGDHIMNWQAGTWWPVVPSSIFKMHGYTGPYYRKVAKSEQGTGMKPHRLCLEAVRKSDMVFAWIDDPTCYATLFEMGYAHGLGIHTVVAYPKDFDKSELWFTTCCADDVIEATNPIMGLQAAILRYPARKTTVMPPTYEVTVRDMTWSDPDT